MNIVIINMCSLTVYQILTFVCSEQDTFEDCGWWSVRDTKGSQCHRQRRQAVGVDEGNHRRDRQYRVQSYGIHQSPTGKKRGIDE